MAFPLELFGDSLALLFSTVIGEVHNIGKLTGVKVLDITFPKEWENMYGGPVFGIEGIREILGEKGKNEPLLISPVKPCVGLSPQEFADRVYHCLIGGFNGVKDDELLLNPSYCRFEERVVKTVEAVKKAEDKTGKKKIYFAHVGTDIFDIDRFTEVALKHGASGLMYSPLINGIDIVRKYKGNVPVIAHNNLTYGLCRSANLGVSYNLLVKVQRLCGADVMVCPAPYGSFEVMTIEEHLENVDAAIGANMNIKKMLLGFSGSQSPETLFKHYETVGHGDFGIFPGGAVYEHPMGISEGAKSFVQAIEAIKAGKSLEEYAQNHEELKQSLEYF